MSGGSLNYGYSKVESIAEDVRSQATKPLHVTFANHLDKVAEALRDLEWVLSGDYASGDEDEALRRVLRGEP